jgi:hypothetical protein
MSCKFKILSSKSLFGQCLTAALLCLFVVLVFQPFCIHEDHEFLHDHHGEPITTTLGINHSVFQISQIFKIPLKHSCDRIGSLQLFKTLVLKERMSNQLQSKLFDDFTDSAQVGTKKNILRVPTILVMLQTVILLS